VKDDVFITGFDGNLRRPIEERRSKAPPARDVADLIWSIEASGQVARERAARLAADEQGRLGAALAAWVERATSAYLAAYFEFMSGPSIWPEGRRAAERMLDFFLIEKAFDTLEIELTQHPDAMPAALARILRILSQPVREAA
jgi:maltose alpha-D-glucosyltransferase / alpha-amylase